MLVEWLDKDLTRATVTRGWLRKYTATVYRSKEPRYDYYEGVQSPGSWFHEGTDDYIGRDLCASMDSARDKESRRQRRVNNWSRVSKLPEARVHGRNS